MEKYLAPTEFIDFDHPRVRAAVQSAVGQARAPREKAVRIFYAVRDGIRYNPWAEAYIRDTNRVSRVLERGDGYCVQKAITLVAFARASGIPARLGLADIRDFLAGGVLLEAMGTNVFVCHGYAEIFLEEEWVKATPAFEVQMCMRRGFRPVEFDGRSDAILPAEDLQGRPHIEYVHYHGIYDDMPYAYIMQQWEERYSILNKIIETKHHIAGASLQASCD